jgi:ABC-type sugar transport system ATPase subunit
MLLEVKDLSYSREHKEILNKLTFEISAAKITSVLGANGSGKSTLLSLLAGLLDPSAGKIVFKNKKVIGPSFKLIPGHDGIALVRQDARLTPFATVRENIKHVLRMYDSEGQEAKLIELAQLLGLNLLLDRVVKYLSGGEQQRVAIAAALASEPDLLLMDEPFSQSDVYLKQELKGYLTSIVEQLGISLLFVTHSPEDALSLSDTIMVLHDGKMIESGSPNELYFKPKCQATAFLTGHCNFLKSNPFKLPLHQIKNDFLIRPDQLTILKSKSENYLKAEVVIVEFNGFYEGFYLRVDGLDEHIYTTLSTSVSNPKKNEWVWLGLKN